MGKSLQGTKSHDNLKGAFAGESQANRRYLYFARRADIEGFPDIGGLFRDTSEAETGSADWPGILRQMHPGDCRDSWSLVNFFPLCPPPSA